MANKPNMLLVPYTTCDNQEKSFSSSQITYMINKCVPPNEQDGRHYEVPPILAGLFGKHHVG